jgi:hypothetical protein
MFFLRMTERDCNRCHRQRHEKIVDMETISTPNSAAVATLSFRRPARVVVAVVKQLTRTAGLTIDPIKYSAQWLWLVAPVVQLIITPLPPERKCSTKKKTNGSAKKS